jgi:hypothetical protein
VPVGTGTFLREVSTIADIVTLPPAATVKKVGFIDNTGDGYFTLMLAPGEIEPP